MIGIDSIFLARILISEEHKQNEIIENVTKIHGQLGDTIFLNYITLSEVVNILEHEFYYNKLEIINVLNHLINDKNFRLENYKIVILALNDFLTSSIGFPTLLVYHINKEIYDCKETITYLSNNSNLHEQKYLN